MANESKRTKEEYLLLLITGGDRESIRAEWGMTNKSFDGKLKKWGIADTEAELQAVEEYKQQLAAQAEKQVGATAEVMEQESIQSSESEAIIPVRPKEPFTLFIRIPLVDVTTTFGDQLTKVEEEIEELIREVKNFRGRQPALSEAFDVLQSLIGAIYLDLAEVMTPDRAAKKLRWLLLQANQQHLTKIQRYTKERGWKVIERDDSGERSSINEKQSG